jgi:hypothetical protein
MEDIPDRMDMFERREQGYGAASDNENLEKFYMKK